ncbi:MAG: hypothetical protein IJX64_03145 [Clostridia bacterium]|nr:hypothetical protein [Clostridia bacterium]
MKGKIAEAVCLPKGRLAGTYQNMMRTVTARWRAVVGLEFLGTLTMSLFRAVKDDMAFLLLSGNKIEFLFTP